MRYELDAKPNFEGSWHLHAKRTIEEVALKLEMDQQTASLEIKKVLKILQKARSKRVWPGLDDKILTFWNGMMIGAMAHAGDRLGKPDYIHSAEKSLVFIRKHLWDGKRLKATARNVKSQLNAYLDDYVLLASGIVKLLGIRWATDDFNMLIQLLQSVLKHFEDRKNGGFFFNSDDHEKLIARLKPDSDGAIPSGNGVAASLYLKIGHLLGEHRYLAAAEKTLTALWRRIKRYPAGHGSLLTALGPGNFFSAARNHHSAR